MRGCLLFYNVILGFLWVLLYLTIFSYKIRTRKNKYTTARQPSRERFQSCNNAFQYTRTHWDVIHPHLDIFQSPVCSRLLSPRVVKPSSLEKIMRYLLSLSLCTSKNSIPPIRRVYCLILDIKTRCYIYSPRQ